MSRPTASPSRCMPLGFAASSQSWLTRDAAPGLARTGAGGRRVMTRRVPLELDTLTIRIPMRLQRRGGRKLIITPEGTAMPAMKPRPDETLIKALVRAHRWRRRIESRHAKSITDLAEQEGVTVAYVCRLLPLTCLAPDIVEVILDGRHPKRLRLDRDAGEWTTRVGGAARRLGFVLGSMTRRRHPPPRCSSGSPAARCPSSLPASIVTRCSSSRSCPRPA